MSEQTANNELRNRFNTVWANRIPVAWPNAEFIPPSPQSPWCRFSITNSDGQQTTFGSTTNNHRFPAVLFIQIFTGLNTGDAVALQRADEAAAIFRNWAGTNIRCREATVKTIGVDSYGWYQVNVIVPLFRDELI